MAATWTDELREALGRRDALVIVGTGVSISATQRARTASWPGLLEEGIEWCARVGKDPEWVQRRRGDIKSGDLQELIGAAEQVGTFLKERSEYTAWLRSTVGQLRAKDKSVLEALAGLGTVLATTNYDDLLEEMTGRPVVTWKQNEVEAVLRGHSEGIVHFHGHWKDPDSVILGIRDYERVLGDQYAQAILRAVAALRTVIFVGCGEGLDDPNFGQLLDWAGRIFTASPYRPYLLTCEAEVAKFQNRHRGIRVVSYGKDFSDLAPFLRSLVPQVFQAKQVHALWRAIEPLGLSLDQVLGCYREVAPSGWTTDGLDEPHQAIWRLADAPKSPDGSFPLVRFAQRLGGGPDVDKWIRDVSGGIAPAPAPVRSPLSPSRLSLVVKVEPVLTEKGRYLLRTWAISEPPRRARVIDPGGPSLTLDEIERRLRNYRGKLAADLTAAGNQMLLELILPQELLPHAVDQWLMPQGRSEISWGRKFPVIVRPWERLYNADLLQNVWSDWKTKWDGLGGLSRDELRTAIVWEPDPTTKHKLLDRLSPNSARVLACTEPLSASKGNKSVLNACIDSGTPVAMWLRESAVAWPDVMNLLEKLIVDGHPDLPDAVLKARRDAPEGEAAHPGNHLALLWDPPDRLPPDVDPPKGADS